jgi:hypothetical protein
VFPQAGGEEAEGGAGQSTPDGVDKHTKQLAFADAAGVDTLDAVVEGAPADEAPGEGEVGGRWLVGLKGPAPLRIGGMKGVLKGVVDVVEGHLVTEVDTGLDQDVPVGEAAQLLAGHECQAGGVRTCLRLDPGLRRSRRASGSWRSASLVGQGERNRHGFQDHGVLDAP